MKNQAGIIFTIALSIGLIASLSSCSDKSLSGEVLASKIQYDVPVNNNDPQLDWWINNLEGSKRDPFLKRIMEAAENGDVKVYDYFNKPMTPDQVKSVGTDTVYQTLMRSLPPYEEYDTMIVTSITYRDITKIRFMEEWRWSPGSLDIQKKVVAIGPVVQKELSGEVYNQLLFWISLDEDFTGR